MFKLIKNGRFGLHQSQILQEHFKFLALLPTTSVVISYLNGRTGCEVLEGAFGEGDDADL